MVCKMGENLEFIIIFRIAKDYYGLLGSRTVASALPGIQGKELPLCKSTGSAICARKEMTVNTFMSMTCLKCQSVIFSKIGV